MTAKRSAADMHSDTTDDEGPQSFIESYKRLESSTIKAANDKDQEIAQLRAALQQAVASVRESLDDYKKEEEYLRFHWFNAVARETRLKWDNADLQSRIAALETEAGRCETERLALQVENTELKDENTELKDENKKFRTYKSRVQSATKQED